MTLADARFQSNHQREQTIRAIREIRVNSQPPFGHWSRDRRRRGPARLVLAVPVAPPETLTALAKEADETICLNMPAALGAIGHYYCDFHQMSDAEVTDLLARATRSTETLPTP